MFATSECYGLHREEVERISNWQVEKQSQWECQ